MIVVDTSVWIEAQRKPAAATRRALGQLLDADEVALALPVRLELLAGIARKDRRAFARGLSALPVLVPTDETWRLIEGWIAPAADKGYRFTVSDLMIAGLTHEIGGLLWSRDADFGRMEQLGLVHLYDIG